MAEKFSVIGNPEHHDKQILDIVTGRLDYAADNLPGKKLFTRIAQAPHAHARIKSIDVTKAMALDGVKAVCTYKDCPVFSDNILYYGQEVAAIAATEESIAAHATQLVEVEYDILPVI